MASCLYLYCCQLNLTPRTLQQLHCINTVTLLWYHGDILMTSLWNENPLWNTLIRVSLCPTVAPTSPGPNTTTTTANQDLSSFFPLEGDSSKRIVISSCEQGILWSWARILPAFPPRSPWERSPSTCDLVHIWPVSSQLPQHFDHILMSHVTTPWPRGRKESQAGVQWTLWVQCVYVCVFTFLYMMCQVDQQEKLQSWLTHWPFTQWSACCYDDDAELFRISI